MISRTTPTSLSMVAASAALTLSGVPFMGPIGGARVGYINGEYVLNPHLDEMAEFEARPRRRRHRRRRADGRVGGQGTSERRHARRRDVRPQAASSRSSTRSSSSPRSPPRSRATSRSRDHPSSRSADARLAEADLRAAYKITDKQERYAAVDAAKAKVKAHFAARGRRDPTLHAEQVADVFKELQAKIVRWNILDTGSASTAAT